MRLKLHCLSVLQTLVTAALLVWLFADPRLHGEGARAWRQADPRWAFLGLLAGATCEVAGVARWWCCLRLAGLPVGVKRAGLLHFTGRFATLFLPGSAGGDAVKIAWLAAEFPTRRIAGVIAALMDRLSGLVALTAVALAAVTLRHAWFQRTSQTAGLMKSVIIFLACTTTGMLLWYLVSRPRFRHRSPRRLPFRDRFLDLAGIFDLFATGGRRASAALGLSFLTLGSFFMIFYCAARSLGAQVVLADLLAIMPIIDVVTLLPITVSGIGLREKAFETLLGALCGVPASMAVLVSLWGFALYSAWSLLGAPAFLLYHIARRQEAVPD